MTEPKHRELRAEEVRFRADLSGLHVATSDDLSAAATIVGQADALEALELGLRVRQPGYNVFLVGLKGTGRFVAVREMIRQTVVDSPQLVSHGYVFNFREPDSPLLITLPAGMGREFQGAVQRFRTTLSHSVPTLMMSEMLARTRQRLMARYELATRNLFARFDQHVAASGFSLVQSNAPDGSVHMADIYPMVKAEPVPMEQIRADPEEAGFSAAEVEALDQRRQVLKEELASLVLRHRQLGTRYTRLLKDTEARKISEALGPLYDDLRQQYAGHDPQVDTWLDMARDHFLDHLESFREAERSPAGQPPAGPRLEDFLAMLQVNLLWDPGRAEPGAVACPVVEENYPTWRNLFGSIETTGDPPTATFLDIRPGSVLRANGGYLLLSARDVLAEPRVYDNLKRILRKGLLEIAPREDGHAIPFGLKPAPIALNLKVVLIGEPAVYDMLYAMDSDFRKIFKIKAELDDSMPLNPEALGMFLSVLKRIIIEGQLPTIDRAGLEAIVEEGVRLAGNRQRITTLFSDVADVMREAAYYAGRRGAHRTSGPDVDHALQSRHLRHNLAERRLRDLILQGKILIEVDGVRTGQVNGLGFYDLDYVQFGMPARISATCATGRRGVVNIEREAALSGSIHDKGVLILSGFLAATFAQDKPLALHANIAFEQSYATVDGDSASLAELLALLSALSGIPLRQNLAVTGSLNQRGGVQPVGGVSEKIQGFFRSCAILGLSGRQGVVIPAQNVTDLHLDREATAAVAAGRFHIYPVREYTEAVELLTERPAADVLAAVDQRLAAYAAIMHDVT